MAEKRRVYWDACIWFAVIKQEPGRFARANYVLEQARRGELEICTSSLTLAEAFRKQCGTPGEPHAGLDETQDIAFEEFVSQDFVVEVQVDHAIGVSARRLLRKHGKLRKPADAVHLATAAESEVDEFHTFDGANLLPLDGLVFGRSGKAIKICEPPEPPKDLFTLADEAEAAAAEVANVAPATPAPPSPPASAAPAAAQASNEEAQSSDLQAVGEPVATGNGAAAGNMQGPTQSTSAPGVETSSASAAQQVVGSAPGASAEPRTQS